MNGSAQNVGLRTKRNHATPTVAPITRAIRAALAVSATAIVLSSPLVSLAAGKCNAPAAIASACTGDFARILADTTFGPPVDLTVVSGDPLPASVYPAGIDAVWAGDVSVFAHAGASIDTGAAADVGNVDDVTLVDGGEAFANVSSANAFWLSSDISIDNNVDIDVSGYGIVVGLEVFDEVSARLDNNADITVQAAVDAYGLAFATGARVSSLDAAVFNDGDISAVAYADGHSAWARGVDAFGYSVGSTVHNSGDIDATAVANDGTARAFGIYSFGYAASSTVDNTGNIHAVAQAAGGRAYATAINSIGYGLDADITNSGLLFAGAAADYAYALSIINFATRQSGSAHVTNDGDIIADAHGNYTVATGVINSAFRYGGAITTNTGSIDARALGAAGASATGIYNYAYGSDGIVDNSGSISAMAMATAGAAFATGIYNESNSYANTHNAGSVSASADGVTGVSAARGMVAKSEQFSDITNDAGSYIDVVASSEDGYALAFGAYAIGGTTTTLTNDGHISARSSSVNGDATAYAAVVNGGYSGIGLLINGGDLRADASVAGAGDAHATGAFVYADVATIFNDGSTVATASSVGGQATATGLGTYGLYSAISNYGDVTAIASADGGIAAATGTDSFGYNGSSFYNASDILAIASADGGVASATGASSIGIFTAYATNLGTISAVATGGQTSATGLYNASLYDAITVNDGSISAVAEGTLAAYGEYEAVAFGAYNLAVYYNSIIDNSGSISASASATTDISGTDGFLVAKALGAVALSMYGYGETTITNSGSITASAEASQGYASAWGAVALAGVYGSASIGNEGSISTYAQTDIGVADTVGAYVSSIAGTSSLVNYGDISASARAERGIVNVSVNYADATGVQVFAPYGSGAATVANYGNIEAHTSILGGIGYATGVEAYSTYTSVHNAADARIIATVDAELFGGAFALGVGASGLYSVDVVNDGSIVAYGHANAYSEGTNGFYGAAGAAGIEATAGVQGDVMVVNNGDVTALAVAENSVSWAQGGAGATGVHAYAKYDATVVNAGDIHAIADAQFGNVAAYGAVAHGKYSSHLINEAGASIVASASVGSLAGDQYAGRAFSFGAQSFGNGMEYAVTYNAGSIISHAVVTADGTEAWIGSIAGAFGSSIGYNSGIASAELVNIGSIEAVASADFGYASAYGTFVRTQYESAITNTGDIVASASAAGGNAFAVGSYANSVHQTVTYNCDEEGCDYSNPIIDVDGGESSIDNSGHIVASVNALGGVGYSYGAVAIGAYVAGITNSGQISAIGNADDALAVGGLVNAFYGDALLQNSGVIRAVATGDIANASGVVLLGGYDAQLGNTGTIVAAAYGVDATAIAVSMESNGSNTLTNTGTIAALGDGTRIAISSGSGATSIANSGSITGAILTGDLDDNLHNAVGSLWHAVGESDFGAGDDHIVNHGTIVMDDAAIRLGGYATGNTFDNFGTLSVSGATNVLDMDTPFPVNNNGVITFVDGAADDMLTIVGDFAGQGDIHVDASGLNPASDRLYIDGSVAEPTTQTLNVNLLDMPTTASMYVPLASVSGDSSADNFVLGNVGYDAGFLSLDFSLNASIDASNATADVFSLGVAVTGLSDTGTLAATIAPGAQSLVNAQIGTWRQRMGVVPEPGKSGLAPWVRMFADSGDVNPAHGSNFGPGGNFGFEQSNHGWELGLDARPTESFAVGVLFADSEGSQHLRTGAGTDRLDGKTFGMYGTLLANDFYVDVSQRWTGFDARLHSAAGVQTTEASARAFNVEAGYSAWTVADIHVVPQVQYTRTEVSDISTLHIGPSTFVIDGGLSSRGRLGVAIDKTFERAGYTWTPYGSLNAVREFDGAYDYSVNGGLVGATRTEGTSAMVELGLGMRRNKLSMTAGVNWIDGGAVQSFMGGQLVVRYSW